MDAPDKSTYEQLEQRNAELEAMLLQITTAAHFKQTSEDYFLPDAIKGLYVYSQIIVKLRERHPELQAEMDALAQELAKADLEAQLAARANT